MQGYLLDTNIVSYWHDESRLEHEHVKQRIEERPQEAPLMISAITLGEIEYGLWVVLGDNALSQHAFREFVDFYLPMVLDISSKTRMYYGMLRARLFEKFSPHERRSRRLRPEQLIDPVTSLVLGIQENDLWIAAQALEFNLVLVTNDAIQRIRDICDELQVENWTR